MFLSVLLSTSLLSDDYQLYFSATDGTSGNDNLLIINTSAANATNVNLLEYRQQSDNYTNFQTNTGATDVSLDFDGYRRVVQDIIGSEIVMKDLGLVQINYADKNYTYDRIVKIDISNGKKTSEVLVASTREEYDAAIEAGFDSIYIDGDTDAPPNTAEMLTTYSANLTNVDSTIVTNGGFSTNQITADDGASLFRVEDDGTVHIGENSIVLADELVSASGNDEIYSSSGTLQLGNDSTHNTVVVGTIEVPDPILDSHAANKRYVDDQILKANKYSDGIGSMALASSSMLMSSNGREGIGLGIAGIGSSSALAIGITGNYDERTNYSLTSSYSNQVQKLGLSGGVHFAW
jgi:hypothetical protein